jgi:hypothetical protein
MRNDFLTFQFSDFATFGLSDLLTFLVQARCYHLAAFVCFLLVGDNTNEGGIIVAGEADACFSKSA